MCTNTDRPHSAEMEAIILVRKRLRVWSSRFIQSRILLYTQQTPNGMARAVALGSTCALERKNRRGQAGLVPLRLSADIILFASPQAGIR